MPAANVLKRCVGRSKVQQICCIFQSMLQTQTGCCTGRAPYGAARLPLTPSASAGFPALRAGPMLVRSPCAGAKEHCFDRRIGDCPGITSTWHLPGYHCAVQPLTLRARDAPTAPSTVFAARARTVSAGSKPPGPAACFRRRQRCQQRARPGACPAGRQPAAACGQACPLEV
jgi:hypothetical protein